MKHLPHTLVIAACILASSSSLTLAQTLLIDPGTVSGVTTALSGSVPYSVAAGSSWNQGSANNYGTVKYSDGSAATGVSVVADVVELSGGSGTLSFGSPVVSVLQGNISSGVFADNPAENAIFSGGANNLTEGFLGMRITGLTAGSYDIYVAAAYIGGTVNARAGGSTPAQQAIWAFAGTSSVSLSYSGGTVSGGGSSSLAPAEILENTSSVSWIEGNNYATIHVTLTGVNNTLYIATTGDPALVTYNSTSQEERAWLNVVQIVSVPEPSSALLLGAGLGALCLMLRPRKG